MDSNINLFFLVATILIIIAYIIFIWTHKTTEEERKRIRKRNEPKVFHKVEETEEKKESTLKDDGYGIVTIVSFLFLFFIYFYKVWTDPEFTLGIVGYLLIIIIIIGCFTLISQFFESEKKYQENLKELNASKNTNLQYSQSSFDQFIAGRMSLAKCFWYYYILVGIVISFLCVYFAEKYDQNWLLIFPITYYSLVSVSLWNCATLYANEKLENKQPYGWAIAAKIYIVLNWLTVISQTLLILKIK